MEFAKCKEQWVSLQQQQMVCRTVAVTENNNRKRANERNWVRKRRTRKIRVKTERERCKGWRKNRQKKKQQEWMWESANEHLLVLWIVVALRDLEAAEVGRTPQHFTQMLACRFFSCTTWSWKLMKEAHMSNTCPTLEALTRGRYSSHTTLY